MLAELSINNMGSEKLTASSLYSHNLNTEHSKSCRSRGQWIKKIGYLCYNFIQIVSKMVTVIGGDGGKIWAKLLLHNS